MSMMNDYEEDLDGFPAENRKTSRIYRAKSTDLYTTGSGMTAKIPPLFDGSTSRFKYEDSTEDWLGLTEPEAEKTRPSTVEQTCRRNRTLQRTPSP